MKNRFKFTWETAGILSILSLSAILNLANLSIEGYANTYYSAGVKSMMVSLKNFFFVAFDPSGFVSIDKPPLGFWIQTVFAKILGFSGVSVILPQALAGIFSVWIIYKLVKKSFGKTSALIAALCLAVTPIFVAASRNNTIDNLLVLCMLLACWPLITAVERGSLKHLLLSLAVVGIGFNVKMVEAYMIVPAIYIAYFLSSSLSYGKKIKHLAIGTVIMFAVSLSWSIAVDLIPAKDRPFIGSSTNNTVMQLIIGHNGLERIGINNRIGTKITQPRYSTGDNIKNKKNQFTADERQIQPRRDMTNNEYTNRNVQPGIGNGSKTGIARLFSYNNLSTQISWMLPLAIIGFIASAIKEKLRYPFNSKRKLSLIFWFTWLVTEFIYFSFSKNVTHSYYLTTMAPSVAALTGIGLVSAWKLYKRDGLIRLLLPLAFIINVVIEIRILVESHSKLSIYKFASIFTGGLGIGAALILIIAAVIQKNINKDIETEDNSAYIKRPMILDKVLVGIAVMGTLTVPFLWSSITLFHPMNGSSPSAGPELMANRQSKAVASSDSKLIQFLEENRGSEKYLVAVPSATTYAAQLIIDTGEPVMAIGGFSGSDKIITLEEFKKMVAEGQIRYAITGNGGNSSNSEIMNWIKENGKLVRENKWMNVTASKGQIEGGRFNGSLNRNMQQLYDLGSGFDNNSKL